MHLWSPVSRRKKEEWVQPIPTLDLRKHCRDNDKVETTITMHWGFEQQFTWIKLAQLRLTNRKNDNFPGVWCLDAYFDGHTDMEHDSAFIISFEVIGVEFQNIRYGKTEVSCFVNPNLDGYDQFSVSEQDYVPDHDADDCTHCKAGESHKIVEYLPPDNKELYKLVKGKRLTIRTGMIYEPDTD